MSITRRTLLSTVPAAALLTVAGQVRARKAQAATGDRERLIANTVAMLAGTPESNARPEVADKLAAIEATARTWLQALDTAGAGELFKGLPLGTSDTNLKATSLHLYEIALATRAPGSGLYGDSAVQQRVLQKLTELHEQYYGDQSKGYYGNWFNWEIGISTDVSRTLVLLAAVAPADLVQAYVTSMDAYLRNGKNGDVDLDSRFHTGANLADITGNRILQAAVLGDDARLAKAVADLYTVFATVDPYNLQHGVTDGYYADGSFLQHASVAYTGSYGKGLLTRAVQTVKVLDGTSYASNETVVPVVQGWVVDGFAPLIFEGYLMEIVKGRAVSRTTTGYADVAVIVEAIVDLSGYSSDALALSSYIKHIRQGSRATLTPTSFVSPVSIMRYAEIMADAAIPAADLNPAARSVAFNAMDRAVHRRPGYAFALARSSRRISAYEYMSGENLMPWFQGAGAHYLYLAGQDHTQAFGVDYYTTMSPYRLAGVTAPEEVRRTVPELYGTLWYDKPELGFTSSSESQNTYVYFPVCTDDYSGGAVLGAYGVAGLVLGDDAAYAGKQAGELPDDFVAYRNAEATKSWFLFDDEIVVLAAGVRDSGRAVTTTFDSRIAGSSDVVSLTEGDRWLRYANDTQHTAIGYRFLAGTRPTPSNASVTASRRVVRTGNPDTKVTKQVFTLAVTEPAGSPDAAYAYAIVPNATAEALAAYEDCRLTILANTPQTQAVKHSGLGIVAVNGFTSGDHHAERLVVDGPASVLMRTTRQGEVSIAVADPTTQRDAVSVTIHGRTLRTVDAGEGVQVRPVPGGTRIDVRTRHAYGRSVTVRLRADS
ncbi:MAG: silent information regulator protein Sir2 [Hamadaea sp.]|uniref:polysaccharide lyase family 8 super-sandwich domain-containing protein n=1 Tax=Hamadaea sp. TaxID=2024425 RepID=UPI0017A96157|nr:polysaccharide lyase family 8 super-sandwich domain-containing protein [Hamadaea sp.]NUR71982.1 silent information regulator protein Sir2 [Hamadaea sp.]NUT22950.1 silent information regulator protein Sir2 [Hamadaea sp.]